MALELYTNTYTDVDTNIMDSDDLVNEFWRVASFLNAWSDSIGSNGVIDVYEEFATVTDDIVNGDPANGIIQKFVITSALDAVSFNFTERAEGDPYRVYITLRFQNSATTFTVNGPAGETHAFGLNRTTYAPSQSSTEEFSSAMIIATYGKNNGLMINVFADNVEVTTVSGDDALSTVAT